MTVLLLGLLLAAIVAFAGPTVLPQQARSPLADISLRIIGVLGMLFAIASTSLSGFLTGIWASFSACTAGDLFRRGELSPYTVRMVRRRAF